MIYQLITTGFYSKPSYTCWMVPGKRVIIGDHQTMYLVFIKDSGGDIYQPVIRLEGKINAQMPIESAMLDLTAHIDLLIVPRAIEYSISNEPIRVLIEFQSIKKQHVIVK